MTQETLDELRDLYQKARTSAQAGEYVEANSHLEGILKLLPGSPDAPDPNRARVFYDMGSNYAALEDTKQAFASLRKAVDHGFWDHSWLLRDPSLKSLRSEKKEFEAVVDRARRSLAGVAFGLKDLDGNEIKKEDYAGKVIVIDIWGTWCHPCRMEIPHFKKLQNTYGKDGLAVIGLTWERRPPTDELTRRVRRFVEGQEIQYTVAMIPEGVLRSVPRLGGFPTTLYVGRDGYVADRVQGAEPYGEIEKRALKLLQKDDSAGSNGDE
jgi:thiol-disulfide isomerase/thioredoxin